MVKESRASRGSVKERYEVGRFDKLGCTWENWEEPGVPEKELGTNPGNGWEEEQTCFYAVPAACGDAA